MHHRVKWAGTFVAAGLALIGLVAAAAADQVRFHGETTGNALLLKDTLQNVLLVVSGPLNCPMIDDVRARIMPKNYVPADGRHPIEPAETVYERWTVTACGRKTDVLIAFWPAPQGGMMFRVGYPFPR